MSVRRINIKEVRTRAAARGFLTVGAIARHIGCSRPAIYFAIERPKRYPRVFERLKEALGV